MAKIDFHLIPDEYYSIKDIDRLFAALEKRLEASEVMRSEQTEVFLNVSRTTLNIMCRKGLPYHTVPGLSGKIFLRSELIDFVKKH